MLLALFNAGELVTLPNIVLAVVAVFSLIGNYFQFRNKRTEHIHETDLRSIASLEKALETEERLRKGETARADLEKARADGFASELANVKPELVALMAIDVHELLEFAKMKRKLQAQDKELADLNDQLVEALRKQPKQLKGGGDE